MSLRAVRTQFAIILSFAIAACGGGGGSNPPPPLQSQTISFAQQGTLVVMVGATLANAASGGAGTGAITYQSSNTSVLTVNATSGVATGVAIGAATVTATKAADASFNQAQATYTVSVQTTTSLSLWISQIDTEILPPQPAVGKQLVVAPAATCATPENASTCPGAQSTLLTSTSFAELLTTLTQPSYYALRSGSVTANATFVSARRFSERIGHAALFFNNRYWVIGGGEPDFPGVLPLQHRTLADVWSSADGRSWKLETVAAPWGPRWFHQAVVFNGAMWVIDGAPSVGPTSTDVWRSTNGVNWTKVADSTILPWHSTHLNVTTFNNEMWAVSGGTSFSSTDGVSWAQRSTSGAIGGINGRGYASLTLYNGSLWYIGGSTGINALPADARNDVWKSSNGVDWLQVTPSAQFEKRLRHSAFVMNGRLWVFGGQISDGGTGSRWALDAWSTTDGVQWTEEDTDGLDASYLAKVVEPAAPDRVTLIGGIQRGYSNAVWQTTTGRDWTNLSTHAQFSPRSARGASFNGQLWLIGGGVSNGHASGSPDSNEIWRSSNGIDWSRVATTGQIFSPRDGHCVVVFQNKLWVIGGWDNSIGAGGTETRMNDVWSSSDGVAWTKHDPAGGVIFAPRVGHEVVVFANKLWVIAGNLQNGANSGDVWSSPDGVTWTEVSANVPVLPRNSHRGIEFAGEMWLTGGAVDAGNGTETGTSDILHSADGITWFQVGSAAMFPPRMRHATTVLNGRLYVLGGTDNSEYGVGAILGDVWSSADGITWVQETAAGFTPRWNPAFILHSGEMTLAGGFGLSFLNDVWRSNDGKNWRVGFSQDILVP
ncbi:MAG TPA: hypothetical protein VJT10_08490 [Steroidobacteraceae bacterium]|nr:hypothetical protein [Steroidobacteraceae bacterium]